jgi:hypothetical protein
MHAQRLRDPQHVADPRIVRAVLDPLERPSVDADGLREVILGHAEVQAPDADAVTDGFLGVGEPLFVGHPSNARLMIILCLRLLFRIL